MKSTAMQGVDYPQENVSLLISSFFIVKSKYIYDQVDKIIETFRRQRRYQKPISYFKITKVKIECLMNNKCKCVSND